MTGQLSARSEATTRRTYNRPLDDEGTRFETWEQTVERAQVEHQRRLWADAGGTPDDAELAELRQLGLSRAGLVSGRTLWLGGTKYAYERAASQFNCSGLRLDTVYDMVDAFWLLLNGCGVGGRPRAGTLHGYPTRIQRLEVVPSVRPKEHRGAEENREELPTPENDHTWTIRVGDSGVSWARVLGKMLVSPRGRTDRLVLDVSDVRGPGGRLKGYGWISNGAEPLVKALTAVHHILNRHAGNLLTEEAIGDVFNWCGTILSSRRAAEILLLDAHHPYRKGFSVRKKEYWLNGNDHRRQSNNSLIFWQTPMVDEIADLLYMNLDGGEPGFINGEAAVRRAPWFDTCNPCAEILLPSHGFCNLCSLSLPSFGQDFARLERAVYVMARANYRQTCVNLKDDILQRRWHQTNESLRLCGVSFTGIVQAPWLTDYDIRRLRNSAIAGMYSMADELKKPRPKAGTTVKPEGTRSKISGTVDREVAEGMHRPLGRYIFNWINFSANDPLVGAMEAAGYRTMENPSDPANVLVRFPVEYRDCRFDLRDGKEVNLEPAVAQLRRYRRWNDLWADHNVSSTVSLSREEVPEVAAWVHRNWGNSYVATSFLQRADPTKTARDLGHPYLPQEVVTEETFREAQEQTREVDWDQFHTGWHEISDAQECPGGACPTK